jgi:MFS superfamily sulfate permease-like transporter
VAFYRLLPRWPGPLIVMVLPAAAVAVLDLGQMGVATVGSIPRGLPPASIRDFSTIDFSTLLPAALGVTIVAYTDNVVTAVNALEEVRKTLAERGIVFALTRVKFEVREILASTGFIDRIGEDKVFMTLPTAVNTYQEWYAARHGGDTPSPEP